MARSVLFICTGNYYRSRYAELLFRKLAEARALKWASTSRGVATDLLSEAQGAISPHVLDVLPQKGIAVPDPMPRPRQLREADLMDSDLAIGLDEQEHRPYLEMLFPRWADRVTYWDVRDLDRWEPVQTLSAIERRVEKLVASLR